MDRFEDDLDDGIQILPHISIPEAQNAITG
jgi:hypothetical protein